MKFLRHIVGTTKLDKQKNQCIREKTGAQNIVKEINQYQKKWLQLVQRMGTNRIPKQALQYRPIGRRNIGRPKKRWTDQLHFEDQGTGNTPKPSWTWWWWWCTDYIYDDGIQIDVRITAYLWTITSTSATHYQPWITYLRALPTFCRNWRHNHGLSRPQSQFMYLNISQP